MNEITSALFMIAVALTVALLFTLVVYWAFELYRHIRYQLEVDRLYTATRKLPNVWELNNSKEENK